jgi:hypothetical protein
MALVRPIVYVYQELATVTVAPSSPQLNTCYVGPAYHIQDYPTDEDDIGIGKFVKSPFTTMNGPCGVTGRSSGRPDDNADFITITDPPNHTAGAELDAASVDVVFDMAALELHIGADLTGDGGALAANAYAITSATATFTTDIPNTAGVPTYATRLIVTKNGGSTTLTDAIIKVVRTVDTATKLTLTSEFTAAEMAILAGGANLTFRVETVVQDSHIDAAYVTVVGNEITVKTGATGVLITLDSIPRPVCYAEMYVGYRELRLDLTDIHTLDDTGDIETVIGRVDERNPLAAAAQVAFANTSTTIQVFGVESDDLAGQTDAKDKLSTRDDVYCIVPVTDSIIAADWVSTMAMWRAHCIAYADPTKAKFRIVIGSYPDLPTEKSSCPPSLVGNTRAHAHVAPLVPVVFVDPSIGTDFIGGEVDSTHLLDISHSLTGANITSTIANTTTIFDAAYTGAYALYGAMGKKRLHTNATIVGLGGASVVDYAVRDAILQAEGGTPIAVVAACTASQPGGPASTVRLTKVAGAFTGVSVGDVAKITNTAGDNYGAIVVAIDGAAAAYINLSVKDNGLAAELAVAVEIHRPLAYAFDATVTGQNTFNKALMFASVQPGDIVYSLHTDANPAATTNVGMWIVTGATAGTVTVAGTTPLANDGVGIANVAIFSSKAGNGATNCTARERLDELYDATATFLSSVALGEHIEIPYPVSTNPIHWDTTTTQWPINTIVSDQIVRALLDDLEELAPKDFVAGYTANDCPYRINIDLDKNAQVTELNTVTTSLASSRVVMVWPNECTVTDLENALTGVTSRHHGQYLACTVGGMICGLPPHQGLTFIAAAGISQIFNSNFYFSDANIDDLSENGWYVFLQDSETSAPYSAHEVTTDVSAYEYGELMFIKDFDFVSLFYKRIMQSFVGRYNIMPETLGMIRASFDAGTEYLRRLVYPKIGAPILSATVTKLEQLAGETDRVEIYAEVDIPRVLNKIGLHLIA